jgi:hypothetical protein
MTSILAGFKMVNKQIFRNIFLALFFLIVFLTYSNRVDDPDLWWHLKYGELLYQTNSLPREDNVSFTAHMADRVAADVVEEAPPPFGQSPARKEFWISGAKRAWLSDVILYAVFIVGGFPALGVLKALTFVCAYLLIYLAMKKMGSGDFSAFFVLSLVAIIGADFDYNRPQIFSFLLFCYVLYLLHSYSRSGKGIYLLPLLMLVWANLHGGFILGVVVILVFFCGESLKYLAKSVLGMDSVSSMDKENLMRLGSFSFVSVFFSLANPTGYKPFLFPFIQEKSVFTSIEEYAHPVFSEYHAFWLMLALLIFFLFVMTLMRRLDIKDLLLSTILITASLNGRRYIPVFAFGTAAFLSYSITICWRAVSDRGFMRRFLDGKKRYLGAGGYVVFVSLAVFMLLRVILSGNALKMDVSERIYPSGAVSFLRENGLKGNMFNLYDWGGYLIWSLYPEHRTFVDGRTTSETAYVHYYKILGGENGKRPDSPLWKRLLDAYGTDVILISAVSTAGILHPLADRLYMDSGWELVFADGKSMLFVRNVQAYSEIIRKYRLPKDHIINEIIAECEFGILETPATLGYYELLGYIYMRKNQYHDALTMFEKYLSMNPYNEKARSNRDALKKILDSQAGGGGRSATSAA